MTSKTTEQFRRRLRELPERIQERARRAYRDFIRDPSHPGLRFKRVHPTEPIYSVRITGDHRALGVATGQEIVWFWIGAHDEYGRLISTLC